MAIERLHLAVPHALLDAINPGEEVDRLLDIRQSTVSLLYPGEYDITPHIGPDRGRKIDMLTVFDDGTGIVRVRPQQQTQSVRINWNYPGQIDPQASGQGTLIHLPQDQRRTLIIAEHHQKARRGIWFLTDVISWRSSAEDLGSLVMKNATEA